MSGSKVQSRDRPLSRRARENELRRTKRASRFPAKGVILLDDLEFLKFKMYVKKYLNEKNEMSSLHYKRINKFEQSLLALVSLEG